MLVIAGPTASGKTRVAIELAEQVGAEIVNADSQQVYRHFDIGTAKPTAAELARVTHHLVSCVDPLEAFSAARFQQLADAAIAEIAGRGRRVVVVGGTGLYIRVLLHGVVPAPGSDEALRAQLEQLADGELHAKLAAVDPITAKRLPTSDRVRLIRALEIHSLTGEPASAHRERHAFQADRYPFRLWVLDPPREPLYAAINARAKAMFDAGLVEETRALIAKGYREAAPMGAVGYAQALQVIDGAMTVEQAIADVAQKTRHYAKRQWTWFRKERGAEFVPPPYRLAP
ncbi:MAG: tRNA (adenosine(37)-N6)-dimethylallyltransferase MiaA [Myxococcaceae bacterium]|nr:tRNA (adenosine(37)-N6)-dimethylallyltransferase MiaA [Myxococcaceae bacterium]